VDGWYELHGRYGRLPMKDLLAPAIAYARNGFPVSEVIAYYFHSNKKRIGHYPGFAETYMPGGDVPKKGEMFRNPRLANTLEAIAEKGRDEFYKGDIARRIDAYMAEQGGLLSYDDLAAHESEWVTPVSTNYRGWDVYELPPNGQGIAALQILNILEGFDIASMGFGSAAYVHTLVEAKKLAFEDRAKYYVDMDFADVPVEWLVSKEYADERRQLISPDKASLSLPAGDSNLEEGDTIYLTVADSDGNMVSLIQSNYRGMGTGLSPDGLGFIFQDRGELFDLEPGRFNTYEPRKRPFHTIIPAFITKDGRPFMSFGVMGGAMQPQGHAQVVVNIIDFGMDLQAAGDAPRIRHSGSSQPTGERMTRGGTVYLETGIDWEAMRELRRRGHIISVSAGGYGGYQAIMVHPKSGVYVGASESRKDGHAAGY